MSEFYRGGSRGIAVFSAVCLIGTLALSGCAGFKRTIGLEPTMPDEFEVEAQAPLTIPPDFALRPPKPGTSRPQDVSTAKLARQDLDTVGAGKPGQQVPGLTLPMLGSNLQAPNPNAEIVPGSLASRLLASGTGGPVVENRQTKPLPGVY